jgi:peptide deformylase
MARLPILEYPDPRLRTRAQPVDVFDSALSRLVDDLFETMYASRGIGLAATQVDVHRQVIVVDVSGSASAPEVFINPVVLADDAVGMVEESCLSLPGLVGNVARATRLRVAARTRDGGRFERDLEDLLAVCVQHEMDHLKGTLFVDHLSPLRRLQVYWQSRRKPVQALGNP